MSSEKGRTKSTYLYKRLLLTVPHADVFEGKRLRPTFVSYELGSNSPEHAIHSFTSLWLCGKLVPATAAACEDCRLLHINVVEV
jgi:hypothetical protein